MINLLQPCVGVAELEGIREVFDASWLGAGDRLTQFELRLGQYLGCDRDELTATVSCTEGLFQVVEALGLGHGDEVILPSVSFLGAAHAVRAAGARVVLCDVDPKTLNPTVEHIESVLSTATKAVLILHYGGYPGDLAAIAELARHRQLTLIEDSACSLGSFVAGQACGTFGDVGIWSFDAVKLLTTGDGGMIWCKDPVLRSRIRKNIKLGVGSSGLQRATSARWWEIEPTVVGRRATMNDVAAAIGLAQLKRLPEFLLRREAIAANYDAQLSSITWLRVPEKPPAEVARFYYWIQMPSAYRDVLATHLLKHDIYTNFRYWPLHKTRMYASQEVFPGADSAAESTLLLPVHQGLTDGNVSRVVEVVQAFPGHAD